MFDPDELLAQISETRAKNKKKRQDTQSKYEKLKEEGIDPSRIPASKLDDEIFKLESKKRVKKIKEIMRDE